MFRKACGWAAMLSLSLIPYSASAQAEAGKRVSALYTSWDDYYFYAAFQVNDRNVVGVNNTPISQPQQDDDIEIFFETDRARAKVRTPRTFQMAVSAAGGAYFSVGTNGKIPKAKVVYTYKYAAKVDGTLNDPSDSDTGYTIEVAIPWAELGVEQAPKDGAAWGFNVISRDRDSTAGPADRFYSLSGAVQSAADVQDPSKWASIVLPPAAPRPRRRRRPSFLRASSAASRSSTAPSSVANGPACPESRSAPKRSWRRRPPRTKSRTRRNLPSRRPRQSR